MAWLLRRSLVHAEWVQCIGMLPRLARYSHHLGEAHLLVSYSSLHSLNLGLLDSVDVFCWCVVSVYNNLLLLRRC